MGIIQIKQKFFFLSLFIVFHSVAQVHDPTWKNMAREKDDGWYATDSAKAIAENVLLYQRDIGGWPKNVAMHKPLGGKERKRLLVEKSYSNNCTTDNGATTTEMGFLSKIYRHQPDERYKEAFLSGLNYILEAQYENGGWPQFYPLRNNYSN